MGLKLKISKLEKMVLFTHVLLILIACGVVLVRPISSNLQQNLSFLLGSVIMSVFIHTFSRFVVVMNIRTSVARWEGSGVGEEHRRNVLVSVVNAVMYLFTSIGIVFSFKALIQLDINLMLYYFGFLGVLVGGYNGKNKYIKKDEVE